MNRIICRYTQNNPGPLFICLAGIHGNEHAGISALQRIEKMLKEELVKNPKFVFHGTFYGLAGNIQALERNIRYLETDLNRIFSNKILQEVMSCKEEVLKNERLELKQLISAINNIIEATPASNIIILDLHTTSAEGGLFAIPSDDPESIKIAKALHAPVIKGFMGGLKGTTIHYFTENKALFNHPVTALVFEAGQHEDPLSVNRIISAIINCMRTIGCVEPKDVENHHDEILISYSAGLPRLTSLVYVYKIVAGENFKMNPGFLNFQPVKKGQALASNNEGIIEATCDGYILMPLYQNKGEDGFFIVEDES